MLIYYFHFILETDLAFAPFRSSCIQSIQENHLSRLRKISDALNILVRVKLLNMVSSTRYIISKRRQLCFPKSAMTLAEVLILPPFLQVLYNERGHEDRSVVSDLKKAQLIQTSEDEQNVIHRCKVMQYRDYFTVIMFQHKSHHLCAPGSKVLIIQ